MLKETGTSNSVGKNHGSDINNNTYKYLFFFNCTILQSKYRTSSRDKWAVRKAEGNYMNYTLKSEFGYFHLKIKHEKTKKISSFVN